MISDQQPTPSVEEARAALRRYMSDCIYRGYSGLPPFYDEETDAKFAAFEAAVCAPLKALIAELERAHEAQLQLVTNATGWHEVQADRGDWKRRAETTEKVVAAGDESTEGFWLQRERLIAAAEQPADTAAAVAVARDSYERAVRINYSRDVIPARLAELVEAIRADERVKVTAEGRHRVVDSEFWCACSHAEAEHLVVCNACPAGAVTAEYAGLEALLMDVIDDGPRGAFAMHRAVAQRALDALHQQPSQLDIPHQGPANAGSGREPSEGGSS